MILKLFITVLIGAVVFFVVDYAFSVQAAVIGALIAGGLFFYGTHTSS